MRLCCNGLMLLKDFLPCFFLADDDDEEDDDSDFNNLVRMLRDTAGESFILTLYRFYL